MRGRTAAETNISYQGRNRLIIASATFKPSIAAEVIPPAYPAPSPHGYTQEILLLNASSLSILTGEDVLLSTPDKRTSPSANPRI